MMPLHLYVDQNPMYCLCCARKVFYYFIPFKALLLKVFSLLQFVEYVYSNIATSVDSSGILSLSILFAYVLLEWYSNKI